MQRPVIVLLAVASLCGCRPVVSELEDVRLSVFQRIAPPAEPMGGPTSGYGRPGPFLSVTLLSHAVSSLEEWRLDRSGVDCPDLGGVTVQVDGDRLPYDREPSGVLVGASSGGLYRCGGSFLGLGAPEVLEQGRIVLSDAAGDHVFDVPSLREPVGLTLLDTQGTDGAGTRISFGLSPWAAAVAPEVTKVTVYAYSQDYDGWMEREELRDGAGLEFGTDGFTATTRVRGDVKLVVTLEANDLACEGSALPGAAARHVQGLFDVEVP